MEEVIFHLQHSVKELQHKLSKEENVQERIRLLGKIEGIKESLQEVLAYQKGLGL